jgi:hypothetical protein
LAIGVGALVLLGFELLPWASRFNPRIEADKLYAETPLIRELKLAVGTGRYVAVRPRSGWRLDRVPTEAVLPPNSGTVYGLRSVDGYDSLFPAGYRAYAAAVEGTDPAPLANGNMLLMENARAWAPQVGVVVAREDERLDLPGPRHRAEGCALYVTRGPGSLRAYLVENTSLTQLHGDEIRGSRPLTVGPETLNSVTVEVPPGGSGTVVLRDEPYPGWAPFVNGRPADILGSRGSRLVGVGAQQGPGVTLVVPHEPWWAVFADRRPHTISGSRGSRPVAVGPAVSRVAMVYYPATVVVGAFLSLCALAALLILGVGSRVAKGARA